MRAIVNPLRGISADSAYVASVIRQIPGPVLAVGHSYGGAVITNAGSMADNVVGLVYVAAFAPDEGESLQEIEGGSQDSILPVGAAADGLPGGIRLRGDGRTVHRRGPVPRGVRRRPARASRRP